MQLGGLSRATFSKHSQLQAFIWLDFEFLATTIWNALICSLARDFWAGVCLGELKSSSPLSLPFPPHQCLHKCLDCGPPLKGVPKCSCGFGGSWEGGVKWLIPADAALQGERPAAPDFPALLTPATVWGRALESKPKPQTKAPTSIITRARMHPQLLNCYMQLPSKLEGNYPNSVYNLCHFIL